MPIITDLITERIDRGERIDLDEFGIEYVIKDDTHECRACGSPYRRTHGGWGSICYLCTEPWPEDDDEDD